MATSLFGVGDVLNASQGGTVVPQSFVGTAGQTLYNLTNFTYTPGTNSLTVYINGNLQMVGRDYTETSSTSFTLNEGVIAGDFVDVFGVPITTLTAVTPGVVSLGGGYSLQNYINDSIVNVKNFPFLAKLDGITDDTAAIQAMLTFLSVAGGIGYFPPGQGLISASLLVTGYGVRLFGSGTAALWNGTSSNALGGSIIVKTASMTTEAIIVTGGRCVLDTITILGKVGNTNDGIYIKDAQNCVLNDVCVSFCGNDGIRIGAKVGSTGNCNGFQMKGCTSEKNGRHGLTLYDQSAVGGPNANAGSIVGFTAAFNTGNGVHNENGCFNVFTALLSQQNTGFGVALVGTVPLSLYTTFVGGDIEGNVAGQWSIGVNAKHNSWIGSFPNYPAGVDPGQFNVVFGDGTSIVRQLQFRVGGGILSAYESGTWVPNLVFSGGNGDLTYTGGFDTGTYIRVGNLVTVVFYILFNVTTAVGNMSINNLPVAAANLGNSVSAGGVVVDGMKLITGAPVWQIVQNGATIMTFNMTGTGTASPLAIGNCNATNNVIRVSATYQV
jgi:hypothetical protein